MAKKHGGRPKMSPEERLGVVVKFRAREDERDLIYKAAQAAGETSSEWMRGVLVRAAKRRLSR